jgi:hypothetical protein
LKIIKKDSAIELDPNWNRLCDSVYQKDKFLKHAEKYNSCNQRYFLGFEESVLVAGAVVYSLKVNMLTFAKHSFNIPMTIIGIPASVDAYGIIGNEIYYEELLNEIIKNENGIILCLNYNQSMRINDIIEMKTLPTMIYDCDASSWEKYLESIRHNYRRRILKAQNKFDGVTIKKDFCSQFTDEHYHLYLNIIKRTKTKLEILEKEFFMNLSSEYTLHSFYSDNDLITWHITISNKGVYYFLFGGINYDLRDKFDSYFNNLIYVVKEGVTIRSKSINLGQTAEVSKNRLGAKSIEKKMFIYHKNPLIRLMFKSLKSFLGHQLNSEMVSIFKRELVS